MKKLIVLTAIATFLFAFILQNSYAQEQYMVVNQWGQSGRGQQGSFSQPNEISIDSEGNVYVTDFTATSNQIQKFSNNGSFLDSWGSLGFGPNYFANPTSIAIDSEDNVYVTDFGAPSFAVQKFTSNGTFLDTWGAVGLGAGQFINPAGIAVDSDGYVYVSDFGENNHVVKFDSNGNFINTFGEGQLNFPLGLAVDSEGKIFAVDRNNDRIQVFARS